MIVSSALLSAAETVALEIVRRLPAVLARRRDQHDGRGDGEAGHRPGQAEALGPAAEAESVTNINDATLRQAVSALRRGDVRRWLLLLEVADLLLDVLSGFLALYLVAAARATPAQAALGVAIRLTAGLAGDVLVIRLLERFGSRTDRLVPFRRFCLSRGYGRHLRCC